MMSFCLLVCLILTLQLVAGNDLSMANVSTTNVDVAEVASTVRSETKTLDISTGITSGNEETQDHQGQCVLCISAWWFNELYGIIALAAAGTILLISVILCIVSCCLWKRIKCSRQEETKNRELDLLDLGVASDSNRTFPVQEEPPAIKDVGISDVENCTLSSGPPKETPQDGEDQTTDGPDITYPPPENIPMLL